MDSPSLDEHMVWRQNGAWPTRVSRFSPALNSPVFSPPCPPTLLIPGTSHVSSRSSFESERDRAREGPPVRISVSSLQRLCSQSSDTMSDAAEGAVAAAVSNVVENLSKLPAAQSSHSAGKTSKSRLFNRERTVHELFGGGKAADVLLWKNKPLSAGVLAGTTLVWILFEWSGYTLLSLLSNVLLFLIVVFFLWSNAAGLLNRSPPPIPELKLSEDTVVHTAKTLRVEINKVLAIAHDVALGKDFKLFLKVVAGLWVLSTIGAWFNFLTLVYIGVIASHTVPVLYEKYEDEVDKYGKVALDQAHVQYKKIDALLLSKIPRAAPKDKKSQ
ncbi:hypothetical protein R1flu_002877 [Riccia fluitans]|uniref:Reticulon-like protein n=1 Tax=Riccia fluitans TaxID=41844 RepID=A0ABD1YAD2_9MARC